MGHMVPKGTLLVMSTNSGYEDASTPMHAVGPISGEAPRVYPPSPSTQIDDHKQYEQDAQDKEAGESKKTGVWEAGTGRMFDPDRWIKDGKFDPNAGPSLPFSLGQRGCFGKSLAVSPSPHPRTKTHTF